MDRVVETQVASEKVCLDDISEGATLLLAHLVAEVLDEHVVHTAGAADPQLREAGGLP
ncbi:MAG: hypothetical protein M3N95_11375 [Actinomycetota bacterium]|nr:hypothetical protein [Actinomycetota bacterium]